MKKGQGKNIVFSNFFFIGENRIHLQVKKILLKRKLRCTRQKKKELIKLSV